MGGHSGGPIAGIAGRERECRELDARFLMPCGVVRVPRWFCGATLGWARQPCSSTRCALPPTCGPCGLSVSSRTVGSASGRYTVCLSRFMDRIGSLPARQRDAIGTAFGCRGRPAAGSVLVGLATLTVFSEVAAERALLCLGTTCNGSTGSPLTCWVSLHVDSCWRGCPDSTLRASTNIQGLAGDDCQFVDGFLRTGLSENRRPGFRCWVLSSPPNSIGGPVIGGRRFLVRGCMPR